MARGTGRGGGGSCQIRGLALAPGSVALPGGGAAAEENPELGAMQRRLWICSLLALPLLAAGMAEMVPGATRLLTAVSPTTRNWLELLLATPAVLWGGWPFFQRGCGSVVIRSLN